MSSILDALKELETREAPATTPVTETWIDRWGPSRRAAEVLGIVTLGLILGAGAFLLFIWVAGPGPVDEPAPVDPAATTSVAPAAPTVAATPVVPAPAPSNAPSWLALADPPRARVAGAPGAAVAPRPRARVDAGGQPAADDDAADAPPPAPPATKGGPTVTLGAIHYSPETARRAVTLQVGGNPTTLHEGQSAGGVEVQLIMPEAVYIRRGAEIIMLTPGGG